jgi:hypothetical protein
VDLLPELAACVARTGCRGWPLLAGSHETPGHLAGPAGGHGGHIFIVRIITPKCNIAMLWDPGIHFCGIPGKIRRGGDVWSRDLIQESPVPHGGPAATINFHSVFPEGEDFHNYPRPVPFLLSDSDLVLDTDMVTDLERIQLPAAFVVRDFHPCISLGKAGLRSSLSRMNFLSNS